MGLARQVRPVSVGIGRYRGVLTGRKYRLDLTPEQEAQCEEFGRVCRAVWNTGLEQRRAYRRRGAWVNYHVQARELAAAKAEHPWLKAAPSHVLQQTLMDLDRACRTQGTFRVRWRSSRRWRTSFRFPDSSQIAVEPLNRRHARVKLPKLGWVRFRMSRGLDDAVVRSATVSRDGGHWFVAFLVDDGAQVPEMHAAPGAAVGIDRGVAVAIASSDGQLMDRQFLTSGERRRVMALQRRLSRCARSSRGREKTRDALASIRSRERRRRRDLCAQASHQIAAANAVVVLEDLKTRQMTRSAKGTLTAPGRNVRAKSGLNRAILAKGWHQFALALASAARSTPGPPW